MKPNPRSETSFLMVPVVTVTSWSLSNEPDCRRTVSSSQDHTEHATTAGRSTSLSLGPRSNLRNARLEDDDRSFAGPCRGIRVRVGGRPQVDQPPPQAFALLAGRPARPY